ncbi:MAG: TetR/AcrR family transcriptional regulator [Deltaproteobacteria bacterium]|nr:TetR/AcrR family transcriptional regulator [Deltaproteobacteria bacterium]
MLAYSEGGVPGKPAEPLRKRERNALRNRNAILSAAREVFSELGYGAATIRDIIRRTQLAAGTFYNYFPDKESVLQAIMEEFTQRMRARVHATRMEARTTEELLRSSFLTCFRLYAEEQTLVEMMARNAGEMTLLGAGAILEPAVEELIADLRAKEKEGVLPPIDIERLARAAVALAAELGVHMLDRKPFDIEGTTEFVTQLMLGGMERLTGKSLADDNG